MIEAKNISKRFGRQQVLNDLSLNIEKGESVVIMGRSGCGKSILLKHLIGLISPDAGSVMIDGKNIVGMSERELIKVRHKFGMLFQGAALFDSLSVAENVAFPLKRESNAKELTPQEIEKRVDEALEMVELEGTQKKKPSELSGGMRKRVGLARAIIYRPEVVLYDEPTTGLDPIVSASIDQLILRVNERLKVTTIVVTHDMRSARTVGQRMLLLHQGKVYASGETEEFFNSSDPLIKRFVNGIPDEKDDATP